MQYIEMCGRGGGDWLVYCGREYIRIYIFMYIGDIIVWFYKEGSTRVTKSLNFESKVIPQLRSLRTLYSRGSKFLGFLDFQYAT
jgi:hypothetical protein